jgi:hypothetical protein
MRTSESSRAEDLQRWLDAGLLRQDQVEAIEAFEDHQVPASPGDRRVSVAAEVLGYVGAVLAVVGAVLGVSGAGIDIGTTGALILLGAATLVFGSGFFVIRSSEPAFVRLDSVLGFLSSVTLAWFVGVLLVAEFNVTGATAALISGIVVGSYSMVLWRRRPRGLQQFAVFSALLTMVTGALGYLDHVTPTEYGAVFTAVGALWLVLAGSDLIMPPRVARALGAITVLVGAQYVVAGHRALGVAFGVAVAIVLLTWGALERSGMLVGVGAVGLLAFVPQLVVLLTEDTGGNTALHVALGLFIAGSIVLAVAVLLVKRGGFDHDHGRGHGRGRGAHLSHA